MGNGKTIFYAIEELDFYPDIPRLTVVKPLYPDRCYPFFRYSPDEIELALLQISLPSSLAIASSSPYPPY